MEYILLLILISMMSLIIVMESLINKRMNIGWLIIFTMFVLLSAIRGLNVPDTWEYKNYFTSLTLSINSLRYTTQEPGFVILGLFVKKFISIDYKVYFGIITAINLLVMKKVFNNYNLKLLAIPTVIYISFYGFYFNYITLRVGLAFSLIYYSWSLFNKSKLKSALIFLLACSFHISSVFTLPAFILINENKIFTKKIYYFWLMLISILYLVKIDRLFINYLIDLISHFNLFEGHRFSYYINNLNINNGISSRFYFNIFYAMIFIIFNEKKDNRFNYLININLVGLTIISLLSTFMWIERITDFYVGTNILLASFMFEKIRNVYLRLIIILPFIYINILFVLRIINRS